MNNPSASAAEFHLQPQEVAYQPYDPSQAQAYDQSYYAYYQYGQYSDPQQQYSYHQNYANAYQPQQEPSSVHPPGVPIVPATVHTVGSELTHLQNQQNSYYPHRIVEQQQQQQHFLDTGSGGLNAGNLGFQEQHLGGNGVGFGPAPTYEGPGAAHRPIGQSSYRGKSKRGGRSFRGGRGQAPAAQEHAAPVWPPPRMAWCELCRVDCNTSEILEKHKSGKKHKKNLQRLEELQNLNSLITRMPNVQMPQIPTMPGPQIKPEIVCPPKVDGSEEKQAEAVTNNGGIEVEQRPFVEEPVAEQAQETERSRVTDDSDGQGRGFKRSMRGGRGGKRVRINECLRTVAEPPYRPNVLIPLICELCSIRCESSIVFESHLAGKKHNLNLRKLHRHRVMGGPASHRAFRPPKPNAASALEIPQASQALFTLSIPSMIPNPQAPPASVQATAVCSENPNQPNPKRESTQIQTKNAVSEENKGQVQSVAVESEAPLAVSTGSAESETNVPSLPQDNNSAVASTGGSSTDDRLAASLQAIDEAVPSPGVEAVTSPEAKAPTDRVASDGMNGGS